MSNDTTKRDSTTSATESTLPDPSPEDQEMELLARRRQELMEQAAANMAAEALLHMSQGSASETNHQGGVQGSDGGDNEGDGDLDDGGNDEGNSEEEANPENESGN